MGIDEEPVPTGTLEVVEFQPAVLLAYVGMDAEAEALMVEDDEDDEDELVREEELEVDEAIDDDDDEEEEVELVTVEVIGFFAQSQWVN